MNNWLSVIEGLIFMVGDEGITFEQLISVTELSEILVEGYINQIKESCDHEERGVELVIFGGLYKFITKKIVHEYGAKLFALPEKGKLSQAALETLAIIAYKQPITRSEIEELRGVSCDNMIRKLLAKALIKECGRSESVGRPMLFEVTDEFMDAFKLTSINELPELPSLLNAEESDLFSSDDE